MDMLALAAAFCVMGAIIFAMLAYYQATASPRTDMERRLGSMMSGEAGVEAMAADFEALRPKREGRTPIISSLIRGRSWTSTMAEELDRADIRLTVSEFVSVKVLVGLLFAAVPLIYIGTGLAGVGVMGAAGAVGYAIPSIYVGQAKSRRIRKLDEQLVEALSLLSSSLKAGFGLMQAMELASRQLEHPLATELRRTLYDVNVGASTEDALQGLSERSGSKDLDIVVTAMLIQQSTGGNLSEILDNVGHTMRERIRIRGEIKTLTSQQMLTGFIIGGLPFFMAGAFTLLSPDYMKPLIETTLGNLMLIGAGMLELFGILLIKRILAIEV